ncbi:MAG: AEC family transporter [Lachnospiraceae bacterium]|nr:AEC family transporter [Lachnospiraceae bacterium]
MSLSIIVQQMGVICILVAIGIYLQKRGVADALTTKNISTIVMDVCNPALILASILAGGITATHRDLLIAAALGAGFYALLVVLGFVLPHLLRVEPDKRRFYNLMTVYTNTGFLGIPIARAVLPANSILYVIVVNVFYSLLFYTHGMAILGSGRDDGGSDAPVGNAEMVGNTEMVGNAGMVGNAEMVGNAGMVGNAEPERKRSAGEPASEEGTKHLRTNPLRGALNAGTIMAIAALVVFWFDLKLPPILANSVSYIGNATVFLSMALLGINIARSQVTKHLRDARIWAYIALRMVLLPTIIVLVMHACSFDPAATLAMCLMAAVPVGNLPMIQAEKIGEDTSTLASAIAVTTAVSMVTITVLFISFSAFL